MAHNKRVGILTGGGDCPGLNAATRATAKTAFRLGYEVIGIRDGWEGLIDGKNEVLDSVNTSGIIDKGGTILGLSRISPFRVQNGPQQVIDAFKELKLEAFVVLGGEGTLSVTAKLSKMGLPVIGIPKTIDNDIAETNYSIGFQTAVQIATDALDRLRSTAESHHRVMFLEVMGHHTGWIATYAGMGSGADAILIPEIPMDQARMEELCAMLKKRNSKGTKSSIVVVAEGTKVERSVTAKAGVHRARGENVVRAGGVGKVVGELVQCNTGLETRVSSLDYIQRGGTPVAYDRSLATALGVRAAELLEERRYGEMTAIRGNRITSVPLERVVDRVKTVNLNVYRIAELFFG